MGPNEQLPTVRALAQELGVNPNTVQKAYQMLERDGVIYSVTGRGSFISPDHSPLKQRRSLARDKLVAALEEALDTGIAVEEIHTLVEECNRKRGGNRNAGD